MLDEKDLTNLVNHISQNDYFGTLATKVSLICQIETGELKSLTKQDKIKQLNKIVNELVFLQQNYKIIHKIDF